LLARACAAQTKSTFLKLAGPQLVQMFIGDGAKLVRDAFALAKEKAPAIIFIDELDAIGKFFIKDLFPKEAAFIILVRRNKAFRF
jgi:ATP-dependent 26S proteasome regulatory subunit